MIIFTEYTKIADIQQSGYEGLWIRQMTWPGRSTELYSENLSGKQGIGKDEGEKADKKNDVPFSVFVPGAGIEPAQPLLVTGF